MKKFIQPALNQKMINSITKKGYTNIIPQYFGESAGTYIIGSCMKNGKLHYIEYEHNYSWHPIYSNSKGTFYFVLLFYADPVDTMKCNFDMPYVFANV